MKTIEQVHEEIQAALKAARETHEYRAEGASIEFTNAMVTRMREAGVTRSQLARLIKATPAYISKILRGATNFSLDSMVKIANALNCELRLHLQPSGAKSRRLALNSSKTRNGAAHSAKSLKALRNATRRKRVIRGSTKFRSVLSR
jgi:transcriptional regulator with XRE-family HTH domain